MKNHKTQFATVIIFGILILGCGGNNNSNSNASSTVVTTDVAQCSGSAVNHSAKGRWASTATSADGSTQMEYGYHFVDSSNLELSNSCRSGYHSNSVVVHVSINLTSDTLNILESNQQTSNYDGIECDVAITAAAVPYQLVGNCLQLSFPGQQPLYLIRQGAN